MNKIALATLVFLISSRVVLAAFNIGDSIFYKEIHYFWPGAGVGSKGYQYSYYNLKVFNKDSENINYISSYDSIYQINLSDSSELRKVIVDTCSCTYNGSFFSCKSLFRKDSTSSIFKVLWDSLATLDQHRVGYVLINNNEYQVVEIDWPGVLYAQNFIELLNYFSFQSGGAGLFSGYYDSLLLIKYNDEPFNIGSISSVRFLKEIKTSTTPFDINVSTNTVNISSNSIGMNNIKIYDLKGNKLYSGQHNFPGNAKIPLRTKSMLIIEINSGKEVFHFKRFIDH